MKTEAFNTDREELDNQKFLFLSLPRHDGQYTSTPWQIATALAKSHEVMFADNPFTFLDLITGFYKPQIRKRIKAYFSASSVKKDGVEVVLTPFVWPVNFLPKGKLYNFFSKWNCKMVARRIDRFLKKRKCGKIVYVNSFNFYLPDIPAYLHSQVRLNVYHCIDPMVKAFTLKHGKYLQDRAARQADAIISTAPSLQKSFIQQGFRKSFLVPNAANFDLFYKANIASRHPMVQDIPGKVIGYLGNIERRIDYPLLLELVERLPDWRLVLAGPVERQYIPVEILNHPRIHFIGSVPHEEAPYVLARFDVAIIPFKLDEVSNGIYPLKLFEYLAAGKPVVSTNFNPEVLNELNDVVSVASTASQFVEFIQLSFTTDSPEVQRKRILTASDNTWEKRAQLFKSIISVELKDKYNNKYVAERANQE